MRTSKSRRSPAHLLFAYLVWFLVLSVPVTVIADALGVFGVDLFATAALAVPPAVWYWWNGKSARRLGTFFLWAAALTILLSVPLGAALVTLDAVPGTAEPLTAGLGIGLVAAAYALAYGLVYRRWEERLRRRLLPTAR